MATVYQIDIENRFPLYTVKIEKTDSSTKCTVTSGGFLLVVSHASTEDEAVRVARRHLGVRDDVPCSLTEDQRDELAAPKTGRTIMNLTVDHLETYNGTTWKAA